MNRRLVAGVLAGAAAVALAVVGATGATYSEPVAAAHVPGNTAGAGVLLLGLHSRGADARLAVHGLMPGETHRQRLWLAANDLDSTVAGTLTVRFDQLVDTPAPCSISMGKALGEIASGIAGCRVSGEHITGTPRQGNLSRLLAVRIGYAPTAGDAESCAAADDDRSLLADEQPGNLRSVGRRPYLLKDGSGPLVLAPGEGACLAVTAVWPPGVTPDAQADPQHPTDNAAQGDGLRVKVHFQLTQVTA